MAHLEFVKGVCAASVCTTWRALPRLYGCGGVERTSNLARGAGSLSRSPLLYTTLSDLWRALNTTTNITILVYCIVVKSTCRIYAADALHAPAVLAEYCISVPNHSSTTYRTTAISMYNRYSAVPTPSFARGFEAESQRVSNRRKQTAVDYIVVRQQGVVYHTEANSN